MNLMMMKTKSTDGGSLESLMKKRPLSKASITVWLIQQSSMMLNSQLQKTPQKKDQNPTNEI
jgi:hypothetical protein